MIGPIIGQEVVTPHGLGRVVAIGDWWKVRDHITGVETDFSPDNCELVEIRLRQHAETELVSNITVRAREAIEDKIHEVLEANSSPGYIPDWTHTFPKWLPYYDHTNETFSVVRATTGQSAPNNWYWPKQAWEAVIELCPEELKVFMGVRA